MLHAREDEAPVETQSTHTAPTLHPLSLSESLPEAACPGGDVSQGRVHLAMCADGCLSSKG